jgi:hypothetical protein
MYNSTIPFNCDARPVEIEMIRKMVQEPAAKKLKTVEEPEQSLADEGSAFIIKPADQWLKSVEKNPRPKNYSAAFGSSMNCALCLPIPMLVNPSSPYKLPIALAGDSK